MSLTLKIVYKSLNKHIVFTDLTNNGIKNKILSSFENLSDSDNVNVKILENEINIRDLTYEHVEKHHEIELINNEESDDDFSVHFTDSEEESDESEEKSEESDEELLIENKLEDFDEISLLKMILGFYEEVIRLVPDRTPEAVVLHSKEFKECLSHIDNTLRLYTITSLASFVDVRRIVKEHIINFSSLSPFKRHFDMGVLWLYFVWIIVSKYKKSTWYKTYFDQHAREIIQQRINDERNSHRLFMMLTVEVKNEKMEVSADVDRMNEFYLPCYNGKRDLHSSLRKHYSKCGCKSFGCNVINSARNLVERLNRHIENGELTTLKELKIEPKNKNNNSNNSNNNSNNNNSVNNNNNDNNNDSNNSNGNNGSVKHRRYPCGLMLNIIRKKKYYLHRACVVNNLLNCYEPVDKRSGSSKVVPLILSNWTTAIDMYVQENSSSKIIAYNFYMLEEYRKYPNYTGVFKNGGGDSFCIGTPSAFIEEVMDFLNDEDNVFYLRNYNGKKRILHGNESVDCNVGGNGLELLSLVASNVVCTNCSGCANCMQKKRRM